jgi:hypothetical protein
MAKRKSKAGFLGISNTTLLLIGGGVALYYLTRPKTENRTIGKIGETYFKTQAGALEYVFDIVGQKYDIRFPENIWTQHIPYGKSVRYNLELYTFNGNLARKGLTIVLYRMESGSYELTYYLN